MMQSVRKGLLALALLTLAPFAMSAEHPAQQAVIESTNAMLEVLRDDKQRIKQEPDYLDEKIEEIVVPLVDFETMAKIALKTYWRKASADEREAFVAEFRTYLLNTYAVALQEASEGSVEFKPFRESGRKDRAVVRSVFKPASGAAVDINYQLHIDADDAASSWQIWDIDLDGQGGLVARQQPVFKREARRNGVEGVLKLLREKNGTS